MRLAEQGIKMFVDPKNYVFHNELDRIGLEMRMIRYFKGAVNRRRAFEMGHKEYEIHYSLFKIIVYRTLWPAKKIIVCLTKIIPNKKALDFIYFRLAHVLLGIFIFGGYNNFKADF
jgi:hypothetical protein